MTGVQDKIDSSQVKFDETLQHFADGIVTRAHETYYREESQSVDDSHMEWADPGSRSRVMDVLARHNIQPVLDVKTGQRKPR